MSNPERNEYAPQLSVSSRLNHAEHVADAIRALAARRVTQAPHTVEPVELLSGQAIEVTDAANHATFHQLCEQLLANALKVERATTNRVAQRLEVLCWARAIRTAMAHLVAHNFRTA